MSTQHVAKMQLDRTRLARLDGHCKVIKERWSRFYSDYEQIGKALCAIREEKDYTLKGYKTIDDFCKAEFGFGKSQAYRLMHKSDEEQISYSPKSKASQKGSQETNGVANSLLPDPPSIPPKPREPGDDSEAQGEPEGAPEVKDAEGKVVPAHAISAFEAAIQIVDWARRLDVLRREALEFAEGPTGFLMDAEQVKIHGKNLKMTVLQNRATHVCPYCGGGTDKKCACCKGRGWTAEHVYARATKEKK